MNQSIRTFLMFAGDAEAALQHWAAIFEDAEVGPIERWGAEGPGTEGQVYRATITLGGQTVMVTDTVAVHDFTFTPATSFWVDCADRDEVDERAAALAEGGSFAMPPGGYGFSPWFAWVVDRFGVSWQLSVVDAGA